MKNNILFFFLSLIVMIAGCSNERSTNPPDEQKESGKMMLKFNKTETPENVVSITATLTRTGFSDIKATLNIITDTSAEITMQNIAAGNWHLKIEATDQNSIVVYKGETDVTITAGIVTQVMLTLQSTGTNTGGIYIFVNWGSSASGWVDYLNNPVLSGTGQTFDKNGITRPIILVEGNSFKLWFTNCGVGNVGSVGYAVSNDGINWTRPVATPVLSPGAPGSWDAATITAGPVIKVDGVYRMYYSGRTVQGGYTSIGLATSTDCINWTKRTAPVLTALNNWEGNLDPGDVIKIGNTFFMYYAGTVTGISQIGIATSSDGITWTRLSNVPFLKADKAWECNGVLTPSIIFDNNKYAMAYLNQRDYSDAFGLATSTDGISWTKDVNNPFFTTQNTSKNWVKSIQYPCLRKYNNEWRVYYAGFDYPNDMRYIGFAKIIR
jgi:predicted GH43/DUF377 family glycosyl hydrolase